MNGGLEAWRQSTEKETSFKIESGESKKLNEKVKFKTLIYCVEKLGI